jgi:basic membrane protein A and related proteins
VCVVSALHHNGAGGDQEQHVLRKTARLSALTRAAIVIAITLLAAGCSPNAHNRGIQVGLATDAGGLGDHSFADSANTGLQEAARTFKLRAVVLQSRSAADYQPNLMTFAANRFDLTIAGGYDQADDLREVAARFPQRQFAIIDAVVDAPNITSMTFRSEEGSFMAGALAALQSKTKTIGFLGGIDVPIIRVFEVGYAAGAREIDPSVRVLVKYVGDFNDVASGNELSAIMFNQGADIVYAAAGKAGLGAIQDVRARSGAFVIGVDSDQDALAPGKILTSVLKRIDRSVYLLSAQTAHRRPHPRQFSVGLADDGVGLTDFRYTRQFIAASTFAQLKRIRAAVIDGRLHVPKTRAELATFQRRPV